MFKKDIQEFYIKNHIENIYIVKRHHADGNVEEKKSSVLFKSIDEFVRVLIQIRKYDKEIKKICITKNGSNISTTLQEYLDFYVSHFGHKFHSFILEYKNSLVNDDLKNHYIIKKLTKNDIENVAKNSYARVMFMYDSVKYLLYYIKKNITQMTEINESFVKLLMSYLRVSVNPLNLITHVYLHGYKAVPSVDQEKKENLPNQISQNGPNETWKEVSPIKDNPVVDFPTKDHFFCNELCQFVCSYGDYIIKHTISSSYVEVLNRGDIIKSKLSIYEAAKRHIRSYMMKKICSYANFKDCNLNAQFEHATIFNAYEGDLIKFQKIFKRFTQVGSGYKHVSMSRRNFSYIYELILAVYLVKKCLIHLNENIDAVLQVALYTLYSAAKVIIIYLYFNLPKHMSHYFLNVYLLFFKSKNKNSEGQRQGNKTAYIMNRMRRTYRNVLQYVVRRGKGSSEGEQHTQDGMPSEETPNAVNPYEVNPDEVTPLEGKIKVSERKRYRKVLNLLYFQIDSYDKKWAKQKSKQEVKKFVRLHINGSVIQLKYNSEVLLRKKKKCNKKTLSKVGPTEAVKDSSQRVTQQNGTISCMKKRANLVYPDKIEYMKRYAPLYRTKCRSNTKKGGKNAHRNRPVHIQINTVNYSMHNRLIYNYRDDDVYARKEKKSDEEGEVSSYKNSRSCAKHIIGKLLNCVLSNLRKGNEFAQSNTRDIHAIDSFDADAPSNHNGSDDYEDSHCSGPNEEVAKMDESITCPVQTILNEHEKGGDTPESCYLSRNGSIQSEAKMKCEVLSARTLDKSKSEINSVQTVNSKEIQEGEEGRDEVSSEDGGIPSKEVDHTVKRQEDEIVYTQLDPSVGKTHSSVEQSPQESFEKSKKKYAENEEVQRGEISSPEKIQNGIEKIAYGEKADDSPRHGSKTEGHTEREELEKESLEKEKQRDDSEGACSPQNISQALLQLRKKNNRRTEGKYKMFFSNNSSTMDASSDDYYPFKTMKQKAERERRKAAAKAKKKASSTKKGKEKSNIHTKGKEKSKEPIKGNEKSNVQTKGKEKSNEPIKGNEKSNVQTKGNEKSNEPIKGKEKSNEQTKGKKKEEKSKKKETDQASKTGSSKTNKRKWLEHTEEETITKKKGKSNRSSSYHSMKNDNSKRNKLVQGKEKSSTTDRVTNNQFRKRNTGIATEERAIATNGEDFLDEHKGGSANNSQMSKAKPPTADDTTIHGSARKLIFNVSLNGSEGGEECSPFKYEFGGRTSWGLNVSKGHEPICGDLDVSDHHYNSDVLVLNEDNPLWKDVDESQSVSRMHGKKDKTYEQAYKRLDEQLRIDKDMPQFDMPFICTQQVYINERVYDIVKDTEERLKLIVIHLFNYYIIGGIFLTNPFNRAQRERYRNFTSIQENINDIEHTKIFKYSSHELMIGNIRRNTRVSLMGGRTSKRVMIILNRQGKGLNGATYKCTINNALYACKVQQRLYLAKKEIFFSYILKTRKMLKHRKYSEQRKRALGMGGKTAEVRSDYSRQESGISSSAELFFEIFVKGNLYMFPDELHYKVHTADGSSDKSARKGEGQRKGAKRRGNKGNKKGDKCEGVPEEKDNTEEKAEQNSERRKEDKCEGQAEEKAEQNSERKSEGQSEKHSSEGGTSLLIMGTHKHVTTLNELINTFIRKGHQSINEELVLFIVYHLIVALLQLHVLDVLHGDVKIDNILVAKDEKLLLQMQKSKRNSPREAPSSCMGKTKGKSKSKSKPRTEGNSDSSRSSSGTRSVPAGSRSSSSGVRSAFGGSSTFMSEYMLNGKGTRNPNSFLIKKFPLNIFLIDIGRGIDAKNFRNYLFYGEKNCDCYNFLSDSIFTYHIDFIGIAQVASCLLYYKHMGCTKYKYDESIMDQNYTTINNLNLTYMTHNKNFMNNSSTQVKIKKKEAPKGKKQSRCKEIESFIQVKERAYTEDEGKQEKGCTGESVCLEGGKTTGKSSHSTENGPHPVGLLQRSLNCAGNKQKESDKGNKGSANSNMAPESTYFIDYSGNIPMDDRDRKKIERYIDQMKKNNENCYIEQEEERKIKNFSVRLLSKRKKYIEFWEIFFHLLLNFCNVYELSSVSYNSKEIGTNVDKANLFHHKVMNKTENYYFDFCKNNWEEIPQGDQQRKDVCMKEKLHPFDTSNHNLYTPKAETVWFNGDSHNESALEDVHHTDEAKQEIGNLCHHDNTSTDDDSNACSMKKGRCDVEKEALEENPRKQTHNEPHKDNSHQVDNTNAEKEITKVVLDKQHEQTNGDQPQSNSKYFFIKNSISNLKNIKKKMHKVQHKIERDTFEASIKGKNDSYNFPSKEENFSLKRKMIFFENEQNRQKCRKLNDQKYYAKECRPNDTKRFTRYVNKLMKKKAIFVLMFLKRTIEKIFDDDTSRQEILLSEMKNAVAFF
ncbi:hypothetical protein AK88_03946 [Plasmodium fragile]|uniref:Protein kinase domain-containing protein n=1 Tax=Plasmodium fragile TaxID=5857 RepID=A0A0D9QHE9_PLAFR|nr:uncharacterized protein AK88_03946 [Plasmodium fragile]KJP86393.1 hypothetical protein AK88_03946 [Plasmodium fragile]